METHNNGSLENGTVLRRRAAFQRSGNWMKWNETGTNYQRIQFSGEGEEQDRERKELSSAKITNQPGVLLTKGSFCNNRR